MKILIITVAAMLAVVTGCSSDKGANDTTKVKPIRRVPLESAGAIYASLPKDVQRTILAYGGTGEIRDIVNVGKNEITYRVRFRDVANPTLLILTNGTLVNVAPPK